MHLKLDNLITNKVKLTFLVVILLSKLSTRLTLDNTEFGNKIIIAIATTFGDIETVSSFAPIKLPAGLITSAIGAPYFLYLLMQRRHRAI